MKMMTLALPLLVLAAACGMDDTKPPVNDTPTELDDFMVAGGCFWCVEADLERVKGVEEVMSGYAGGRNANPTYQNYDDYGHREVALVRFDPSVITFEELAEIFIRTIDVTDDSGQFCDRGYEYSTAVYYETEAEKDILEDVIKEGEAEIGRPIVTPIEAEPTFYPAEMYHQDYYLKNPRRYAIYRGACGRDRTVKKVWGKAAKS